MTKLSKIRRRKRAPKDDGGSRTKSRYKLQPAFKASMKEASRKAYRTRKGKDFELEGSVILRSLEFIDDDAITIPVVNQITSRTEALPVLRLTHVARLLNTSYQTLWRWTAETQQVPMPVLIDASSGREYGVYHVDEARIMVQVIGEHFREFKYYRSDHEATKRKVFDQIEALRANNFNQEEPSHGNQQKRPRTRRKGKGSKARS